ncbi:MAG: hypothetical protein ACPGWQ_03870, partial [Poseidonia sp.]
MAKHRAGDRRIMSISIPEDLAKKLDRKVGKGRADGRSATIARLIQQGLEAQAPPLAAPPAQSLRAEAPEGAVILFDGKVTDAVSGEVKDGLLWSGGQTKAEFGSFHLHLEFRLPYKPKAPPSSQDRGNSGIYL